MSESVKVAVRVRPFNGREKERGAKCCIEMIGKSTTILNLEAPSEEPKKFAFDFSYWSHDSFREAETDGQMEPDGPESNYSSQRMVFNDLGQGVLNNAFDGFNTSLFAYGQTGAGKSYSMVGYGVNKGIVPITCDEMFKSIESNSDLNKRFEVTFSMLEIYNEQVRDLLTKNNPKGGLAVRQNPKLGLFYVQDLKKVPVGSYEEIDNRTQEGTANRTVASTQMNATSSRAHTVVTVQFDQIIKNEAGEETKKSSVINLVDLAGSERAESTGATGDRLKEGANINKSLSALGNVISALAENSDPAKKKKGMVPYRDSVLTKLLQNALGGNSKTIMIAALSPADINFDETLGTLRYADRAKKIKNKAVVNENPMDKLIRELKEENDKLKAALQGGGLVMQDAPASSAAISDEERERLRKEMEEEIRAQLLANQASLQESATSWEDRVKEAQEESKDSGSAGAGVSEKERKIKEIHLTNLNEDAMLSGVITHFLVEGENKVGKQDGNSDIVLAGLSIQKEHAIFTLSGNEATIKPVSANAKIKVNGVPVAAARALDHKDRIIFGSNNVFVFHNPLHPETASTELPTDIDWDFCQKEVAKAKGFATAGDPSLSKDQQIAQEQVLELLPLVTEVNAISEELNKMRNFEVVLISAAAQEGGAASNKSTNWMERVTYTIVMVKMKNLLNGNTWLWDRGKFMNRKFVMQEHYQRWADGDTEVTNIPQEEDPFWEPAEDVLIGTCNVFLQSLSYALDFDDKIAITDYKGQEEGFLYISVEPCSSDGKALDEEYFVEDPLELVGKPYHYKVTIRSCDIHKARFSLGISVKYRASGEEDYRQTPAIAGTLSPQFKHSTVISVPSVTQDHLDYFDNGCITFLVYGSQEDTNPDSSLTRMSTKELRRQDQIQSPSTGAVQRRLSVFPGDENDAAILRNENSVLKRKLSRYEQKETQLKDLCAFWAAKPENERNFEKFHTEVFALANSNSNKLKARANTLATVIRGHRMIKKRQASIADGLVAPSDVQGSKACVIQ